MHDDDIEAVAAWQESNPLRLWRQARGLSLRKAGPLIGVSFNSLENWEQGQYFPTLDSMGRIAAATGMHDIAARWLAWWAKHPAHPVDTAAIT